MVERMLKYWLVCASGYLDQLTHLNGFAELMTQELPSLRELDDLARAFAVHVGGDADSD